ncbi:uncharacterized protein LOC109823987 [Asparagus officinalis]|uniref:uncharacterized protein LOC109823987 n=1 Tax=Asparagus officinalis TaxID=4686 RepID=UPI00098E72AE|nr:uncharacterized protein LOC109823987 [Asparagus officinalis]
MSTAGATDEVPESPAKKPKLTSDQESTSDESEEDDDCFFGVDGQSEESEDDYCGGGLRKMTDQERALPDVFAIGLIQPAGRNFSAEFIRRYALIAIEDQNEKRKTEGGNQLRLKEVIKCNLRVACPADLYITLEAEDVDTREVDEYEALVMARCGKQKDELHTFRKKNKPAIINPPASTEGSISSKDDT